MTIATEIKKAFDEKKKDWSDSFDYAKEIGECFEDWDNETTYVQFDDASVLSFDACSIDESKIPENII